MQIYWFPTNHWDFQQYVSTLFINWGTEITSLLQFIFSDEMPLKWLFPNQKDKPFYGSINEARVETTEMGIATLVQMAAQRTPVESHQPKYKPRKITKTNKNWFATSRVPYIEEYIKDICLTFNYSSGSSWNSAEKSIIEDIYFSLARHWQSCFLP